VTQRARLTALLLQYQQVVHLYNWQYHRPCIHLSARWGVIKPHSQTQAQAAVGHQRGDWWYCMVRYTRD